MIRLLIAGLLLVSFDTVADTKVTHTFEDGDIIKAEEFNKNFDDLEAAIDTSNTVIQTNAAKLPDCSVGDVLVRGANGWECSTSYGVSGTVSNLDAGNIVGLTLNGVGVTMSANGAFTFPNSLAQGTSYTVLVSAQPGTETCSVTNGTGTAAGPVSNVIVTCVPSARLVASSWQPLSCGQERDSIFEIWTTVSTNVDGTVFACYSDLYQKIRIYNAANQSGCTATFTQNGVTSNAPVANLTGETRVTKVWQDGPSLILDVICPGQ